MSIVNVLHYHQLGPLNGGLTDLFARLTIRTESFFSELWGQRGGRVERTGVGAGVRQESYP